MASEVIEVHSRLCKWNSASEWPMQKDQIAQNIERFKNDLRWLSPLQVVRKNIIHGSCLMLSDDKYFQLKECIAEQFKVHPNHVLVVGSGKLGFSIAPRKQYRPFSESSDIDVVIVSEYFFQTIWKYLYKYKENGGYWEKIDNFNRYLFQGWIRPDKLPPNHQCSFAKEWWEFFNNISSNYEYSSYKISGAIYYSWDFIESYHIRSVAACKQL